MNNPLYLDACIFIANSHSKHENHESVKTCIDSLENFEIDLFSSEWALIEMMRVLIRDYGYSQENAERIANDYRKKSKIGKLKVNFIDLDSDKSLNFNKFFEYLKYQMINAKELHLADAIHNLIMSNNKIKNILTVDDHFNVLKEVITIHPKVFGVMKVKSNVD